MSILPPLRVGLQTPNPRLGQAYVDLASVMRRGQQVLQQFHRSFPRAFEYDYSCGCVVILAAHMEDIGASPFSTTAAPLIAQPPLPLAPAPPAILPPPLAVPPPPPSLPHGWEAAWSDEDKDYYSFREDTGEVTWDLPK